MYDNVYLHRNFHPWSFPQKMQWRGGRIWKGEIPGHKGGVGQLWQCHANRPGFFPEKEIFTDSWKAPIFCSVLMGVWLEGSSSCTAMLPTLIYVLNAADLLFSLSWCVFDVWFSYEQQPGSPGSGFEHVHVLACLHKWDMGAQHQWDGMW